MNDRLGQDEGEREPDFFSDPALISESKPYLARLRAKCPVLKEEYFGSLMVTGYDEVTDVLTRKDGEFSSAVTNLGPTTELPFVPQGDDITDQLEATRDQIPWSVYFVSHDGKKHADQRALVTKLLTHKRLKQNEEYLYSLSDRLIEAFVGEGRCDILSQYAHPVTTFAICDILGIPEQDREKLLDLIGAPPSQIGGDAEHKTGPDPLIFLKAFFDHYIDQRAVCPEADAMTELAHARYRDGSVPTPETISSLARFMFGAAQDTTSRLIAMATRYIAEDPGLQARLRSDAKLIPNFLEEVLRFEPPVKMIYRLAAKSTTVAGVDVPAGTVLNVSLTGASNDPARFDAPEKLDPDRPNVRDHMAFSRGVHGCPGAPLARLEARVAIERLLARTSSIRLSEAHHGPENDRAFRFEQTFSFLSLSDLHIEFEPADADAVHGGA